MPNNPSRAKARVSLPPAGNKIARKVLVSSAFRVQNNFFKNPELGNPSGGPALIRPADGGGGGGSGGGEQLN